AQASAPKRPSDRWTFSPVIYSDPFPDKVDRGNLEDRKRGLLQEKEAEKIRRQRNTGASLEVPVASVTKRSPLEAFQAAFGKPVGPLQSQTINNGNSIHPRRDNFHPEPLGTPSDAGQHANKTSSNLRSIVFVPE